MRTFACLTLSALVMLVACGDDENSSQSPANGPSAGRSAAGESGAGRGGKGGTAAAEGGGGGTAMAGRSGSGAVAGGNGGAGRESNGSDEPEAGEDAGGPGEPSEPALPSGSFLALTYNVAGLPEGLSQSMPLQHTPLIGPLLNGYDLVFLQESWQTPEPNPLAPLRVYHEILVAASDHEHKTEAAGQPLGSDPTRPTALLSDGLNVFSRFPLGETMRVPWRTCVDSDSDCLAFKGFSMTTAELVDGLPIHLYDLHGEAGGTPADDTARDAGIDQLLAFMNQHSRDVAVVIGGDFNLHTDREPAATQFARLLATGELKDACTELDCEFPGSIDKLLFRGSEEVELTAESWSRERDQFVSDTGQALSDHTPVAVRLAWSAVPN